MPWLDYLAYFFGGVFLVNTIPHLVAGVSGRPFQSPFSKPPGIGLSSSTVNVAWGLINLVIAYFLILRVGIFDPRDTGSAIALGLGLALMGFVLARYFGKLHGGNTPRT